MNTPHPKNKQKKIIYTSSRVSVYSLPSVCPRLIVTPPPSRTPVHYYPVALTTGVSGDFILIRCMIFSDTSSERLLRSSAASQNNRAAHFVFILPPFARLARPALPNRLRGARVRSSFCACGATTSTRRIALFLCAKLVKFVRWPIKQRDEKECHSHPSYNLGKLVLFWRTWGKIPPSHTHTQTHNLFFPLSCCAQFAHRGDTE